MEIVSGHHPQYPPPVIQAADAGQARRARSLFRLEQSELPTHTLVALAPPRWMIVGHATLVPLTRPGADFANEGRVLVQTLQPDSELFGRLLTAAIAAGRKGGLSSLTTLQSHPPGDTAAQPYLQQGFRVAESIRTVSIHPENASSRAARIFAAAEKRGKVGPAVRIDDLEHPGFPEVRALLHERGLMDVAKFDEAHAGRGPQPFDRGLSVIIRDGGKILGIQLVSPTTTGIFFACRWVRPNARGGWVNAALFARTRQRCRLGESSRATFSYHADAHDETARFARRMDAEVLEVHERYRLDLAMADIIA